MERVLWNALDIIYNEANSVHNVVLDSLLLDTINVVLNGLILLGVSILVWKHGRK